MSLKSKNRLMMRPKLMAKTIQTKKSKKTHLIKTHLIKTQSDKDDDDKDDDDKDDDDKDDDDKDDDSDDEESGSTASEDLSEAFMLKIGARTTSDLDKIVKLCESALKKGLDKSETEQAKFSSQ